MGIMRLSSQDNASRNQQVMGEKCLKLLEMHRMLLGVDFIGVLAINKY